jgi:indole-3-glycerol phosphate synthase
MTTKLQEIINYKKEEFSYRKEHTDESELNLSIDKQEKPRGFIKKLNNLKKLNLIAEIKKASPSKGLIRKDFDPVELAMCYENGNASCLSVLTDERYFQGHNSYINQIKSNVKLPILRKDFIVDPWQIKESRSLGADCILLIMAALSLDDALLLENEAMDYGMDVLAETHTIEEIHMANKLKTKLIGINNRNLKTMEVDINTSLLLKKHIDPNKIIVAESGLKNHADLLLFKKNNIHNFLIGESLMKQQNHNSSNKKIIRSIKLKQDKLTHFDEDGNPSMVDINSKDMTKRIAIATGKIKMQSETLKKILNIKIKKGDVLTIAKIAGIMAAKKTEQLIPLCHSIPLSYVNVDLSPDTDNSCVNIRAEASLVGKTGVEMEAFTAVTIASLTIYDMCKSIDREMEITDIKLIHKSGGKSGEFNAKV